MKVIYFLALFFLIELVGGVVSIVSELDEKILISSGEQEEVNFVLVNNGGEDTTIKPRLMSGSEVASVSGEGYLLRAGETKSFPILLSADGDSPGEYVVRVLFKEDAQREGQGVQVVGNAGKKFSVFVLGEEVREEIEEAQAGTSPPERGIELAKRKNIYLIGLVFFVAVILIITLIRWKSRGHRGRDVKKKHTRKS